MRWLPIPLALVVALASTALLPVTTTIKRAKQRAEDRRVARAPVDSYSHRVQPETVTKEPAEVADDGWAERVSRAELKGLPGDLRLSVGSDGEEVVLLQRLLHRSGYLEQPERVGYFGSKTAAALLKASRANRKLTLPSIGVAGRSTLRGLYWLQHHPELPRATATTGMAGMLR